VDQNEIPSIAIDPNALYDVFKEVKEGIENYEDEDETYSNVKEEKGISGSQLNRSLRMRRSLQRTTHMRSNNSKNNKNNIVISRFWHMMKSDHVDYKGKKDIYHDNYETHRAVVGIHEDLDTIVNGEKQIYIPKLRECQESLHNQEAEDYRKHISNPMNKLGYLILNVTAAIYMYIINTLGIETIIVVLNTIAATHFFCENSENYAVKLDFSLLAFSVIFPLSFLIQSTFSRRDQALMHLADYRSTILSCCLLTLTVDWPRLSVKGSTCDGRLDLPDNFDTAVVINCQKLVRLSYEYLTMPSVTRARNVVFSCEKLRTKRIRALQNNIIKQLNDLMFDFYQHTEVMRKYGFTSSEASRVNQYHSYLQNRFEKLKCLKYYRTPQALRSFGRAYIFILPWLNGPYFAFVSLTTNRIFVFILASFTYIALLGLLNIQSSLEDPFIPDYTSLYPGIDTVKLDYELSVALQTLEQYHAQCRIKRKWKQSIEQNDSVLRK